MSDIDEIKSRLNIVDIIGERLTLKKAGRNFKGLCPFHNEKTPSFVVSPDRQIWHCFGCGKGGTVFDFVMEYEHVDFAEALEDLAQKAGVTLTRRPADTPEATLKHKLYEVNHLASEFYHYMLTRHQVGEKARLYLKNRGISDKSIQTFSLGYSPNNWEALYRYLRKKGYDDGLLERAGLVIKSQHAGRTHNYYDRFRGRVMFTLRDHRGNVVGFAGRLLDSEAKEAKYINTSDTPVYNKSSVLYGLDVTKAAIQKANEAVVMEGELDVISSFQIGISNAVAIKGSALTEGHVHLLRRFTERILFALDSDMAGDAAARRGIEIADKAGLDMKVVIMPSGKDPDEAARENPGLLKKALQEAIPVYDYFMNSALKRFDAGDAFGKKKISEEVLPIVAKIDNPVVKGHYVRKLASLLDTSEEIIGESMQRLASVAQRPRKEALPASKEPARTREEKLELYTLALLLQGKTAEWYEEFAGAIQLASIAHPAIRRIVELLGEFLKTQHVFLIADFANSLPKELIHTLDEAFLWDLADTLSDEEHMAREWTNALREMKRATIHRRMMKATTLLRGKEGQKEEDVQVLQKELKGLTEELKALEKSSVI